MQETVLIAYFLMTLLIHLMLIVNKYIQYIQIVLIIK